MEVARVITCPDCGGVAHLVQEPDPEEAEALAPGDVLVYRCEDCLDRWDVVLADDADAGDGEDWDHEEGGARPS